MCLSQLFRHDELGELAAERLLPTIAEGSLGGGIELTDDAAMVDRDERVECRVQHGERVRLAYTQRTARRAASESFDHRLLTIVRWLGNTVPPTGYAVLRAG
jgi:hypothetical protein